jgi:nucleoside-diphosphate-sugar epimerase
MTALLSDCDHFVAGAAMIGGISYFHTYAYDLLATNERIIAASCDAAIKAFGGARLQKVTYLSSSMVFESAPSWPSFEGQEQQIPPPISSYGFQKLAVEYFARAAWDQYGLPYTILRPFNCVGIGEARALGDIEVLSGNVKLAMSHVVPDLVQKIVKGQDPLHILGDGTQIRHYTYGGDLARGIATAIEHPDARNDDFNLSTSESTTVLELAEMIWKKIRGNDVPFRYVSDPAFEHDVQRRVPSTDKAREVLGFEATTSLSDMLDEVIPWIEAAIADDRI